jgi:SAM-dependent methyltransferase
MNNHDFCIYWIRSNCPKGALRILDYGCGRGEVVNLLLAAKFDAFGCDIYYDESYYEQVDPSLLGVRIFRMEGYNTPFDDASFDCIINNQVIEHVEELDQLLAEMSRLLKPGGVVLSLFPDKAVWQEGHCLVPFLHWFPKYSRARLYYAWAFSSIGLVKNDRGVSDVEWSQYYCNFLDQHTFYRNQRDIHTAYNKYFAKIKHIEEDWLAACYSHKKIVKATRWFPWFRKFIVRKMAGMVLVARKPFA